MDEIKPTYMLVEGTDFEVSQPFFFLSPNLSFALLMV